MPNANGTGISTYHLSENPQLYEPARSNAFEFIISGIDRMLPAGKTRYLATDEDYIEKPQDIITLSVSSCDVPHFSLDKVSIRRGNSTMNFASVPTFSDGKVTCNDYVGARTKDVLLAWQSLAYDVVDDVVHLAGQYKHDCTLIEYAPDYSEVIRKWTMKGCWISALSEGAFSHEEAGKRMLDVTFVYDRAIPEVIDRPFQLTTSGLYRV